VDGIEGIPGSAVRIPNNDWRAGCIPIVTANNNGLASNIVSSETEVVEIERAVDVNNLTKVTDNVTVEAYMVVGVAAQITAKAMQARVPLLKDDSLGLNFADLLGDDPLSHLLQNNQTLLDNFNALRVAHELLLLLHNDLTEVGSIEVIDTMKVVEVGQGREPSPIVEGMEATDG